VLTLAAAAALGGWSIRLAASPVDAAEYDAAVALERGVRPLVSDRVGELGTITAVTVTRTPDPEPGRVHLLTPNGEDGPRLLVHSRPEPAAPFVDGRLADGRPYEIAPPAARHVSLFTVGVDGQYVAVMGREMELDELVALAGDTEVSTAGPALARVPDGWTEVGVAPMPPWHDGMTTSYDFEGGRRLDIVVERSTPGREALAAFGETEPVDLGTGGWAYRYRPPNSGVLFERGDMVVDLTGDFSEAELRIVAHSLREMLPSEHPVAEPQPF
jgi:hypothetical protein